MISEPMRCHREIDAYVKDCDDVEYHVHKA